MGDDSTTEWERSDLPDDVAEESRSEEPVGETKISIPEAVDNGDLQPTSDVEALATFSEQEGLFSYTVLPVVRAGTTDWRIVIYRRGVQGPVYESAEKVSNGVAKELSMSKRLQDRINKALRYADRNLEIPSKFGNDSRQKKSLHELEVMMEEE